MGGYATHVNRFLSLTLSLMISVTTPLLSFRYASGPALYSALSHLSVRTAPLCPLLGWLPETTNRKFGPAPQARREETREWLETGSASTGVVKGSSGGVALEELTRAVKDLQIAQAQREGGEQARD